MNNVMKLMGLNSDVNVKIYFWTNIFFMRTCVGEIIVYGC